MSTKEDQGPAHGYTELQNMTLRRRSIDIHKLSAIAQMGSKPFQCRTSNSNDEKGMKVTTVSYAAKTTAISLWPRSFNTEKCSLTFLFDLPNHSQHDNWRPILTPRKHRRPRKKPFNRVYFIHAESLNASCFIKLISPYFQQTQGSCSPS